MSYEHIAVHAGGFAYEGWESVKIDWNMFGHTITWELTTTEMSPWGDSPVFDKWNFPPGTDIIVSANGEPVVAGFVWSYQPSADATQHTITIVGKTKSDDIAKGQIVHDTHMWQGWTDHKIILDMVKKSTPDVCIYTQYAIERPVPHFQGKVGAFVYQEAMRILQPLGKMLIPQPDGCMAIVDGASFSDLAPLTQGVNVLAMSARLYDDASELTEALGQEAIGTILEQNLQPYAVATDSKGRPRARVIITQNAVTPELLQKRAFWERSRAAGANTEVTITTPGWHDSKGQLWKTNCDVHVDCPWLQVNCVLRTVRVVYLQNISQGTVTEITLVDPRAVQGEGGFGASAIAAPCYSSDIWNIGGGWGEFGKLAALVSPWITMRR